MWCIHVLIEALRALLVPVERFGFNPKEGQLKMGYLLSLNVG